MNPLVLDQQGQVKAAWIVAGIVLIIVGLRFAPRLTVAAVGLVALYDMLHYMTRHPG